VRDYTCGFRLYRAETLRTLIGVFGADAFLREQGFACMLELLLNLRELNVRVGEVPLVLRYDLKAGASKMRVLRTIRRYAVVMVRGFLPLSWRVAPRAAG
jgi:dolichol-phosphate mannosyltransferase